MEKGLLSQANTLYTEFKQFVELKYRHIRLETSEKVVTSAASLIYIIIIIFILSIFLLFILLALAAYLGKIWNDYYLGFITVAGIFLLIALFVFIFRKALIINPIQKQIIKSIFKLDKED